MAKTTKSRHAAADGGRLNAKQADFARNVARGMNYTEAAIAAGYSPKSARAHSFDLIRHPLIKAELDRLAAKVTEKTVYDAVAAFNEAGEALEYAKQKGNPNAVVKAVELRARLHGLLIDKAELTLAPAPSVVNALAEARARVSWTNKWSSPAPLLPIRCQDDAQDAEYRALPSDDGHGPRDN